MLRPATAQDHDLIERLWLAPDTARWIEPPEAGEIGAGIAQGLCYLWEVDATPVGFALLMTWVPRVMGMTAFVCTRPGQGTPFLRAVLGKVFGAHQAHRIGFDVTADNARALRLYDRMGFQREGLIRECWQRPGGDWVDCALLGLLARDWRP